MALLATYLGIALILAPAFFTFGEWVGQQHLKHRWQYALLAGLLWPVLAVGLLQLAMVAGLWRVIATPEKLDRVDTSELPTTPVPCLPLKIHRPAA